MKKQFQIPPAEDLPLLNGMLSSQPRTLAALFLSAGLLAACGGSGGEGQQSGAPTSSSQQEESLAGAFFDAANEPAAGVGQPAEGHVPQFHADKVAKAVKATATQPAILKAPSFGPAGETIRVGKPVTRVMGQYRNGEPVEGQRLYVGGKEVANGQQAAYTPTAADIGKQLIYRERVVNPRTREEIWAESAPVTVVSSTAPVARKAPAFGPAGRTIRVGEPVTRVTGEYDGGEAFEGFRLRNGKPVENGQQAAYTPVAADIGQVLVYGERVRNPRTGEVITVYSAEVTVVAAGAQAAKPVVTAPRPAPAAEQPAPATATAPTMTVAPRFAPADQPLMVGVPVTRVSGTYQNGVARRLPPAQRRRDQQRLCRQLHPGGSGRRPEDHLRRTRAQPAYRRGQDLLQCGSDGGRCRLARPGDGTAHLGQCPGEGWRAPERRGRQLSQRPDRLAPVAA